jgi:tetratricopeptide (TPR) repeat protein
MRILRYEPHRTIKGAVEEAMLVEMKRSSWIGLVLSGCMLIAAQLHAQAPAPQSPPANPNQQPQQPSKPAAANSFPEDTSNVPVMPSKDTPALPEGTYGGEGAAASRVPLPSEDLDPVRSPDGMASEAESAPSSNSSSSQAGMDKLLPATDDEPSGKRRKAAPAVPQHVETSAEDIEVGQYELDRKNWKAALSRFESAMVLAPDEPEVYWGLAESERHLGNLAEARGYYQKVVDYDPDSKHGKEARKALKEPEIANAKAAAPALPAK